VSKKIIVDINVQICPFQVKSKIIGVIIYQVNAKNGSSKTELFGAQVFECAVFQFLGFATG
jgi:hypothetical protein